MANKNNPKPTGHLPISEEITKERIKKVGDIVNHYETQYTKNREKWPADKKKEINRLEQTLKTDIKNFNRNKIYDTRKLYEAEIKKPVTEQNLKLLEKIDIDLKTLNEFDEQLNKVRNVRNIETGLTEKGAEAGFLEKLRSGELWGEASSVWNDKIIDYDYNEVAEKFLQLSDKENEVIPVPKDLSQIPDSGTQSITTTTTTSGTTAPPSTDNKNIFDVGLDEQSGKIVAIPQPTRTRENVEMNAPTEVDTYYAPDYEPKRDIAGYVGDAARFVMGVGGAMEEIPQYQESPEMRTMIDETMARRNMGLSPEELSLAQTLSERGYAYSVDNARRLAGGSSGTALAAAGTAVGGLQDAYSQLGVQDAAMRRMNRAEAMRFAAPQAEDIERFKFGNEYEQAMITKQAGGLLAQDAMKNVKDRKQYEDTYGRGSQWYDYMKEMTMNMREQNAALEDSRKNIQNLGKTENVNPNTTNVNTTQQNQISNNQLEELESNVSNMISEDKKLEEEKLLQNNYNTDLLNEVDSNKFPKKKEEKVTNNKFVKTGTSEEPDFDELINKVMQTESGGRRYDKNGNLLTSPKGAKGEMQVMPNTGKNPGYGVTPAKDDSPDELARVGKDYLKAMVTKFGETDGLIAYNWGPGNYQKWNKSGRKLDELPTETKNYIKKITGKELK